MQVKNSLSIEQDRYYFLLKPEKNSAYTPLNKIHNMFFKRIFDIIFSLSAVLIFILPIIIIAFITKSTSKGSVFYTQERLTKDNKVFLIYKFRTMDENCEDNTGPIFAEKEDSRCTGFGKFLRRSSLDELPQLFNVLKGDMSVVGPRPERPFFVQKFQTEISKYPQRHLIKSGFTGWAQVNGFRGDTSIRERIEYDLFYMANWSFIFDMKIIMKSIPCVIADFFNDKAY